MALVELQPVEEVSESQNVHNIAKARPRHFRRGQGGEGGVPLTALPIIVQNYINHPHPLDDDEDRLLDRTLLLARY